MRAYMPTTDYTEFLHNVKQEYITNSYELDGVFIFDIELPATSHICPKCGETTKHIKDYRIRTVKFGKRSEEHTSELQSR